MPKEGEGRKGKRKKAADFWGPREEGGARWNKNQMRAFDNVHEKLENMLAAVLEDPEHDDVEVAKLRDELDYLQCKRCELRKGNVIREGGNPDSTFQAGAAHQSESARRSMSRRSRSPESARRSRSRRSRPSAGPLDVPACLLACVTAPAPARSSSRAYPADSARIATRRPSANAAARAHHKKRSAGSGDRSPSSSISVSSAAAAPVGRLVFGAESRDDGADPAAIVGWDGDWDPNSLLRPPGMPPMLRTSRRATTSPEAPQAAESAHSPSHPSSRQKLAICAKPAKNMETHPESKALSMKTRDEAIAEKTATAASAETPCFAKRPPLDKGAASVKAESSDSEVESDSESLITRPIHPITDFGSDASADEFAEFVASGNWALARGCRSRCADVVLSGDSEELRLGAGWIASLRDVGSEDVGNKRWLIFLKSPTEELEEVLRRGRVVNVYRFDIDLQSDYLTDRTLNAYARAVAAADYVLQSGGIGNRYYPLICYTSSLLPPLTCNDLFFWGKEKMQFRLVHFVFHQKGVASKGGAVSQIRG